MKKSVLRKKRAELEKVNKVTQKNTNLNKEHEQDIPIIKDNTEKEKRVFNPFFDLSNKKKSSDD